MFIAPEAELDDGKFDVVMLGDLSLKDMVMSSRRIYAGTHLGLDKVSMRHATKVHAESLDGSEVRIDLDGETPGLLPATFTLMPRVLRVVVP
jgi:diacylglycerol kinase family enzyme